MTSRNREILMPLRANSKDRDDGERELYCINKIITETERLSNLMLTHQLIDTHKRKIYNKGKKLEACFLKKDNLPFRFLNNLN